MSELPLYSARVTVARVGGTTTQRNHYLWAADEAHAIALLGTIGARDARQGGGQVDTLTLWAGSQMKGAPLYQEGISP